MRFRFKEPFARSVPSSVTAEGPIPGGRRYWISDQAEDDPHGKRRGDLLSIVIPEAACGYPGSENPGGAESLRPGCLHAQGLPDPGSALRLAGMTRERQRPLRSLRSLPGSPRQSMNTVASAVFMVPRNKSGDDLGGGGDGLRAGRKDTTLSLVIPEFAPANIRDRGALAPAMEPGFSDPGSVLRSAGMTIERRWTTRSPRSLPEHMRTSHQT